MNQHTSSKKYLLVDSEVTRHQFHVQTGGILLRQCLFQLLTKKNNNLARKWSKSQKEKKKTTKFKINWTNALKNNVQAKSKRGQYKGQTVQFANLVFYSAPKNQCTTYRLWTTLLNIICFRWNKPWSLLTITYLVTCPLVATFELFFGQLCSTCLTNLWHYNRE